MNFAYRLRPGWSQLFRLVVGILGFCLLGEASATWLPIARNDQASLYFDPSSVRALGPNRSVWAIFDRSAVGPDGERSVRVQYQIDCPTRSYEISYQATYGERMARGALQKVTYPNERIPMVDGSALSLLAQQVCPR